MKINFVITELFVGGAERCLTELAIGMSRAGDDVRVFSIGTLPSGDRTALVDRLRDNVVDVTSADADSPLQWWGAHRKLLKWLRDSSPDVCQTFLFHANVMGTRAAKTAGVPIRVGGLRVAESNAFRCAVERRAVGSMTSLICVSEAVEAFASKRLACSREKSIVIPNGVDVARFSSASALDWTAIGWPADALVTLFVGRLHPQKGIDLLQHQIDGIAPAGSKNKLLIVGDGPQGKSIDDWCQRVGVDRVQRLRWQPDVAPLMRACRVLVLPSRYEGMPNVVMEAMAAGKPVVCSRVEGARELLAYDWSKQTFDIGDAAQMTRQIQAFTDDLVLSQRTGETNQSMMKRGFSIDSMVDSYRKHYRLLGTRRLDV